MTPAGIEPATPGYPGRRSSEPQEANIGRIGEPSSRLHQASVSRFLGRITRRLFEARSRHSSEGVRRQTPSFSALGFPKPAPRATPGPAARSQVCRGADWLTRGAALCSSCVLPAPIAETRKAAAQVGRRVCVAGRPPRCGRMPERRGGLQTSRLTPSRLDA